MKIPKIRQINTGKFIGAILDTLNRTAFFISAGNTVLLAVTYYNTGGGQMLKDIFPFMNMWWFLFFVSVLVFFAMIFVYFVITPSYFRFYSNQFYNHDSPMKSDIEAIKRKLDID